MEIKRIRIQAYRSLWDVTLEPNPFRVIVGANNAGKTNLLDAIHFLGEVYRHGIDIAVSRKGGFENIAHRHRRRTKRPMIFHVHAYLQPDDLRAIPARVASSPSGRRKVSAARRSRAKAPVVEVEHYFALKAASQAIDADFYVAKERIVLRRHNTSGREPDVLAQVDRQRDDLSFALLGSRTDSVDDKYQSDEDESSVQLEIEGLKEKLHDEPWLSAILDPLDEPGFRTFARRRISPTRLALQNLVYNEVFRNLSNELSQTRLYQLTPLECRKPGVPIPSPELELHGGNLPAVVDFLKKSHPQSWKEIEKSMRSVVPRLSEVKTVYTTDRRLALQFAEEGFGRPWSSEDISDGTIQSLALFCALFDPRSRLVLIEEPENSVHPWIIRNFADACRRVANKQVLVTSHSPVLVDHLHPNEVEVAWRSDGRTHIAPLLELDPEAADLWAEGRNTVFELLDGGTVPQAISGEGL